MRRSRSLLVAVVAAAALPLGACAVVRGGEPAPLDLNAASVRRLEALPGITPSLARRIVEGRPYGAPEDLVARDILTERELVRIRDRVTVQDGR
jgi:competence protein ComEA